MGDDDSGQTATTRESTLADGGYTVGDSDGCQSAAIIESIIADGCHAVGDGDGGKATTAREFAICFISMVYVLNGRKVML